MHKISLFGPSFLDTVYEIRGSLRSDTNHAVVARKQRLGGAVNVLRNLDSPDTKTYIGPLNPEWMSKKPVGTILIDDLGCHEAFIIEEPSKSSRSSFPFEISKPANRSLHFPMSKVSVISYLDFFLGAPLLIDSISKNSGLVLADLARLNLSQMESETLVNLLDQHVGGLVCSESEIYGSLDIRNIYALIAKPGNKFQFAVIHSKESVEIFDANGLTQIEVPVLVDGVRATGLGDAFLAHLTTDISDNVSLVEAARNAINYVLELLTTSGTR